MFPRDVPAEAIGAHGQSRFLLSEWMDDQRQKILIILAFRVMMSCPKALWYWWMYCKNSYILRSFTVEYKIWSSHLESRMHNMCTYLYVYMSMLYLYIDRWYRWTLGGVGSRQGIHLSADPEKYIFLILYMVFLHVSCYFCVCRASDWREQKTRHFHTRNASKWTAKSISTDLHSQATAHITVYTYKPGCESVGFQCTI